jgi:hypothetical protein
MYASFPAFLFLNATLAGKLLEPLLEFQASSLYRNNYAAPDLGAIFCIISAIDIDFFQGIAIPSSKEILQISHC